MELEKHVGKLFMHSPKAVKRGEPADRVLAVCGVIEGDLLAWKCTSLRNGKLQHPGYADPLLANDPRLFLPDEAPNGAKPTALFKLDSMVRQSVK